MLQGVGSADADLSAKVINPKKYIEHHPRVANGVDGFKDLINEISKEGHRLNQGKLAEGGLLVQARGKTWALSIFQDFFKKGK